MKMLVSRAQQFSQQERRTAQEALINSNFEQARLALEHAVQYEHMVWRRGEVGCPKIIAFQIARRTK